MKLPVQPAAAAGQGQETEHSSQAASQQGGFQCGALKALLSKTMWQHMQHQVIYNPCSLTAQSARSWGCLAAGPARAASIESPAGGW